ncbi:MAG: hypothetical protein AABX37_05075 [Nanoarchaeota archaeon]
MDLRALKKEVDTLSNVEEHLELFQNNWIKPLRTNTNSHLPFLKKLDAQTRLHLNKQLAEFQSHIPKVKQGQNVNDKLRLYAKYLIDLKLNAIQGNPSRSKLIVNQMLNDEYLKFNQTMIEVREFEEAIEKMSDHYQDINVLLQKQLTLEETIFFLDLPHKLYLHHLRKTAERQKHLMRDLGRHFIVLAKEASLKNIPFKP